MYQRTLTVQMQSRGSERVQAVEHPRVLSALPEIFGAIQVLPNKPQFTLRWVCQKSIKGRLVGSATHHTKQTVSGRYRVAESQSSTKVEESHPGLRLPFPLAIRWHTLPLVKRKSTPGNFKTQRQSGRSMATGESRATTRASRRRPRQKRGQPFYPSTFHSHRVRDQQAELPVHGVESTESSSPPAAAAAPPAQSQSAPPHSSQA